MADKAKESEIRGASRAAYLGYLDALLEKKDPILALSLEDLNKLSLLPRFADNNCCNGSAGERAAVAE